MTGDILDAIDGAVRDWTVSKDAVRWQPDAGEAREASAPWLISGDFPPSGSVDIYGQHASLMAGVGEGDLIQVNGTIYRVTGTRRREDGSITFDLEPHD